MFRTGLETFGSEMPVGSEIAIAELEIEPVVERIAVGIVGLKIAVVEPVELRLVGYLGSNKVLWGGRPRLQLKVAFLKIYYNFVRKIKFICNWR